MPANKVNQPVTTFVKGLITEASPLTFPENASLDELNFKLKRDGSRERRLGLDYEANYTLTDTGYAAAVLSGARISTYRWVVPNGNTDIEIGVVQIGNQVWFLNLLTDNPSANILNGGTPITAVGYSNEQLMQFATINNYLIGISSVINQPFLFSYDADTDVVSYETAPIQIRDLYGVDDGLAVGDRPTTLSELHKYNLRNQGWTEDIITTCGTDVLDCTYTTLGVYPSNSDQWGIGRVADLTDANVNKFDPSLAARNLIDYGQVPKGHYIIDLYARGNSRNTQTLLTVPLDLETTYITTVASYAGRVWYSGIQGQITDADSRSLHLSNAVLFSQVFTDKLSWVKCYQEADPTSYVYNEVIDTDGGIIHIPECSFIIKLKAIRQSLFVFATNGVWEISGDEAGFRATSFQVKKVCSVGVYSRDTIEEVDGIIYFWGTSGIYALAPNQYGTYDLTNLTLTTIQRVYNEIPDHSKANARVLYDQHTNSLRWLYYSPYEHIAGTPVEGGVTTIPPAVSTPVEADDLTAVVDDMVVLALTSTEYVIIYVEAGASELWGVLCTLDSATSTTVTVNTPVLLDTTILWDQIAAEKLSDTEFIVVGIDHTGTYKDMYAQVSSISGTGFSTNAPLLISTDGYGLTNGVHIRHIENRTKFLLSYPRATGTHVPQFAVMTYTSPTSISIGTSASYSTNAALGWMMAERSPYTNTLYGYTSTGLSVSRIIPITVSGTGVTVGTATSIGTVATTSPDNTEAFSRLNSLDYVIVNGNVSNDLTVTIHTPSSGANVTYNYPVSNESRYYDVVGTTGNRFAVLTCNDNDDKVYLDYFSYSGGVITKTQSTVVANPGSANQFIAVAKDGLSPTKFPVAYIEGSGFLLKTFVFEMGTA